MRRTGGAEGVRAGFWREDGGSMEIKTLGTLAASALVAGAGGTALLALEPNDTRRESAIKHPMQIGVFALSAGAALGVIEFATGTSPMASVGAKVAAAAAGLLVGGGIAYGGIKLADSHQ